MALRTFDPQNSKIWALFRDNFNQIGGVLTMVSIFNHPIYQP